MTQFGVLTRGRLVRWIAALAVTSSLVSAAFGFVGAEGGPTWQAFNWELAAVAGTAVGTILLAGFTGALAWTTSGDVRATWELAQLTREDQAARERPIVILNLTGIDTGPAGRGTVHLEVINAGQGPAIAVRLSGAVFAGEGDVNPRTLPFVQPGERFAFALTLTIRTPPPGGLTIEDVDVVASYEDRRGVAHGTEAGERLLVVKPT